MQQFLLLLQEIQLVNGQCPPVWRARISGLLDASSRSSQAAARTPVLGLALPRLGRPQSSGRGHTRRTRFAFHSEQPAKKALEARAGTYTFQETKHEMTIFRAL